MKIKNGVLSGAILLILIGVIGCSEEIKQDEVDSISNEDNQEVVENTVSVEEVRELDLDISNFSDFPDEIDGCSCYFSQSLADFEARIYCYVDDFGIEYAFMTIENEEQKFTLLAPATEERGVWTSVWTNEKYELTLSYHEVGNLDETFQQEGTILIKALDGSGDQSITIYGECGC